MARALDREPNYLNIEISNADYDEATERIKYLEAYKHVSRSGPFVGKARDYYASVFRLVFDLDVPVFIGEMRDPSTDGLELIYSITLRSTIGAVVNRGRAYLKLPYEVGGPDIKLHAIQPTDFYSAFWDYGQVVQQLNACMAEAYAALIADGSTVNAAEIPFFTYNDSSGFFTLTTYPFNLYEYRNPPSGDRVEVFMNAAAYPIVKGWPFVSDTLEGELPDANGEDYRIMLINDGTNYLPQPTVYSQGLAPSNPALTSLTGSQAYPTIYPGIVSVQVLSDLPSQGEYVQTTKGNEQAKILTDFKPDLTASGGASTQYYNANFGNCRWIKLVGDGPISQVTVRIEAVDYLGNRHTLKMLSKSEQASMKICFAPREMVETISQRDVDHADDSRKSRGGASWFG